MLCIVRILKDHYTTNPLKYKLILKYLLQSWVVLISGLKSCEPCGPNNFFVEGG